MRVWAVSFFVFFGAAELIHWVQGLTLPFAIYVIAGALLAIASNSEKWTPILTPPATTPPLPSPSPSPSSSLSPSPPRSARRSSPGPQLPELAPNALPPVSLTIAKSQSPSAAAPTHSVQTHSAQTHSAQTHSIQTHSSSCNSETNSFAIDKKGTETQ